jgi:hypothetical protein
MRKNLILSFNSTLCYFHILKVTTSLRCALRSWGERDLGMQKGQNTDPRARMPGFDSALNDLGLWLATSPLCASDALPIKAGDCIPNVAWRIK